jgi:Dolichyl-phosphate-mannose-protein mannosyltransferase
MGNLAVLVWVVFIFAGSLFFSVTSLMELIRPKSYRLDRGFWLSISACAIAFLLCLSTAPAFYRVYHDEFVFISQSCNILLSGSAGVLLKGSRLHPEIIASWVSNPKLPGFAWLEAVVLFVTRDFEHSYFILNMILGVLCVVLEYRIVMVLTANRAKAWWAAVFLACLPVRTTYAMSAASDIAGLFFFLLFLFFSVEYRTGRSRRLLYAALFCGMYSVCIKPFYGIMLLGALALLLAFYRKTGLIDGRANAQLWTDAFCLGLPIACAVPVMLISKEKEPFSLLFMLKNLQISFWYLFNYKQNTVLATLAAVTGLFYARGKLTAVSGVWLLGGLLIIAVFYAGGLTYPGQAYSDRYFLPLTPAFAFLAAQGTADVLTPPRTLSVIFLAVLLMSAVWATQHLTHEARDSFYYHKSQVLKRAFPLVPDDAYVLDASAPLIAAISSKKSIQSELFVQGDHPAKVVAFKGAADGFYNADDRRNMALVWKTLDAEYLCRPLTARPIKEAYLSATPFLCSLKPDHQKP